MFDPIQFRELIIRPVLKTMDLYSIEAEDLLFGTCAQETSGGTYLAQVSHEDPIVQLKSNKLAVGIYQMEPKTHDDIWRSFLSTRPKIISDINYISMLPKYQATLSKPNANVMMFNLNYATAMARVFYLRIEKPIPKDLESQSRYYKSFWNTELGRATPEEYILNYNKFMGTHK